MRHDISRIGCFLSTRVVGRPRRPVFERDIYICRSLLPTIALHVAYTRGKRNRTLEETAFDLRPRSDAYFLEWESFEWKRRVKVDFRFPFLNTSIDFR